MHSSFISTSFNREKAAIKTDHLDIRINNFQLSFGLLSSVFSYISAANRLPDHAIL